MRRPGADAGPFSLFYYSLLVFYCLLLQVYGIDHNSSAIWTEIRSRLDGGLWTGFAQIWGVDNKKDRLFAGRGGDAQTKTNTGILRFAQNDSLSEGAVLS